MKETETLLFSRALRFCLGAFVFPKQPLLIYNKPFILLPPYKKAFGVRKNMG
jgi:hypothetical protein